MKKAIIMIDHGSKRRESHLDLIEWQKGVQALISDVTVKIAHMEIAEPSLKSTVQECISEGIFDLSVVPLFLGRGKHLQEDIPALITECQIEFPEVKLVQKNALFGHEYLNQIILARFLEK
jgi:sirohydrochlorin ferrochelatase